MSELFLRIATLQVDSPQRQGIKFTSWNDDDPGFRIAFKIDKSLENNPNNAVIQIYNLSEDSRGAFEAKQALVTLAAGYDDVPQTIFIGTVSRCVHKKLKADWITEIECGDGESAYQAAAINKAYPQGTAALQILTDVVSTVKGIANGGVTSSNVPIPTSAKVYTNGVAVSGPAPTVLDWIANVNGLEWSIQDGQLQLIPVGTPTLETAVVLTADTGLLGSPGKLKGQGVDQIIDSGIEFTCLLQPQLKPGRAVIITSRDLKGTYRVTKVGHEGDSFAGQWVTKCEAEVPAI